MLKLSLRKKIEFWKENRIWLHEETYLNTDSYGMKLYLGAQNKKNRLPVFSTWALEDIDGEMNIIKISHNKEIQYYVEGDGLYLFGTNGVFYKNKNNPIKKILDGNNYEGMKIYCNMNIICTFGKNGNDLVAKFTPDNIIKIIEYKQIKYLDNFCYWERSDFEKERDTNAKLVAEENEKFLYYYIENGEVFHENVYMYKYELVEKLLKGELIKAYSNERKCNVIVSLVKGKMKVYFEFDKLIQIDAIYYVASKKIDKNMHILKFVKEEGCYDLGIVPKGNCTYCSEVGYIKAFKIIKRDGVTLFCISKDSIKSKFYEGASDIKLSEPVLFENDDVIELKAIPVFSDI